jgi:hypothetical protein
MKQKLTILKWSLLLGAVYFMLVSIAHLLGIKIPLLFIYYDLPSMVYQDIIISFLSFGWAIFLLTAALNPGENINLIRGIIATGIVAVFGLGYINIFMDFHDFANHVSVKYYWYETYGLSFYLFWIIFFYRRGQKHQK